MIVETAISIAQEAEQRKDEIDKIRNIPDDLIQKIKDEGLVRQWTPKVYGGHQRSVSEVMQTVEGMAYHNASIAWVTAVTNCSSLIAGYIPASSAELIYGDPDSMIGGFAGPAGTATLNGEHLEVSGHWSWGSGITHSTHIVGGVKLMNEEQMVGAAIVYFRPDEIKMIDNWYVVGLKGTHSIDYTADKVLIPQERWTTFPVSKAKVDAPLYRFSSLGALSLSVAAVGLGLAQRAFDEIKDIVSGKKQLLQTKYLAQRGDIQDKIGRIQGNLLAATHYYRSTIMDVEAEVAKGPCSKDSMAKLRLASCHTLHMCVDVVRDAYHLAGGSAIWDHQKLEEIHRDIHVVSQHGMVAPSNYRTAGAVALGQKVPSFLL